VGQLATKSDLADLRAAVHTEIAAVQTDIEALRAELRTEIVSVRADTRAEIAAVRTEIEVMRGDFKALNGKVNLLLAFNTPLTLAVLALLWRIFFSGAG